MIASLYPSLFYLLSRRKEKVDAYKMMLGNFLRKLEYRLL